MSEIPPERSQGTDKPARLSPALEEVYRNMSPYLKLKLVCKLWDDERKRHAAEFRLRHPGSTEEEILDAWKLHLWGEELFQEVKQALAKRGKTT
jgi:hypothetical protein